MFDFEKLHPNHKFAFLDGALCGITVAVIATVIYRDYKENREIERRVKKLEKDLGNS